MALNPLAKRISDQATLDSTDPIYYTQQTGIPGNIAVVTDPVGERGNVCRLTLNGGDPLSAGSHRSEIARGIYSSEFAFKTGGGFHWWSYMFSPEWQAEYRLLKAAVPTSVDYSILVQQYHPRDNDGFLHPKWYVAVSEFGVSLNKFNQSDSAGDYERVAIWPVDSLVWHDVVTQVVWSDTDGIFALYLDDRLLYRFVGPTIYVGAPYGCYWKQGIYAPGGYPPGMNKLTIYTQGFAQAYPPGPYSLARGASRRLIRPSNIDRSTTTRNTTATARALTARTTADTY